MEKEELEEKKLQEKKEEREERKEARKDRLTVFSIIQKILYTIVLIIVLLFIVSKISPRKVVIGSSHTIYKIEGINELHLAKVKWKGIAASFKKDNSGKVDTYVRYQADIRTKMDIEKINNNLVVDNDNKKIIITLPEIEFDIAIMIDKEGKNISFIPESSKIEMDEVIKICKNDVEQKIKEKSKIIDTAKESAKNTLQSFLEPFIDENYTIEWKDGE